MQIDMHDEAHLSTAILTEQTVPPAVVEGD